MAMEILSTAFSIVFLFATLLTCVIGFFVLSFFVLIILHHFGVIPLEDETETSNNED